MTKVPLKYLASINAGQSPPSIDVRDLGTGQPFLQGNAEFGGEVPAPRFECDSAPKVAHRGDVLLSVRAPVGALNLADRLYGIGRGLNAIRAVGCDQRFLWWWMHGQREFLDSVSVGSTYKAVTAEDVANLEFPIVALEEQRRIADFLDAETSRIASLQAKLSSVLSVLTERERRILFDCFDVSGDNQADFRALRRVVSRWIDYRGATPEKVVSGVPLVTAKNISDGRIDFASSREFISPDSYDEWMRRGLPEKGDVLLTTEAPLGEVAIVDDPEIALAQRVILLRVDRDAVSPEWLYWYLRSPQGNSTLQMWATGSTALGIKADRLKGLPIPVVSFAEAANRIVGVDSGIGGIDRLRSRIDRLLALLAERRQALITAAVTGQFDVTTASGRNLTQGV